MNSRVKNCDSSLWSIFPNGRRNNSFYKIILFHVSGKIWNNWAETVTLLEVSLRPAVWFLFNSIHIIITRHYIFNRLNFFFFLHWMSLNLFIYPVICLILLELIYLFSPLYKAERLMLSESHYICFSHSHIFDNSHRMFIFLSSNLLQPSSILIIFSLLSLWYSSDYLSIMSKLPRRIIFHSANPFSQTWRHKSLTDLSPFPLRGLIWTTLLSIEGKVWWN